MRPGTSSCGADGGVADLTTIPILARRMSRCWHGTAWIQMEDEGYLRDLIDGLLQEDLLRH